MEKGTEEFSTKQKLLEAGVRLFAAHGYDATSTRMIARETELNVATMSFHFGNKENFYHQVLIYTAQNVASCYRPLGSRVQELSQKNGLTQETAWQLIMDYVDLVISLMLNPKDQDTLRLLFHEQNQNPFHDYPITQIICKEAEHILKTLLLAWWNSDDIKHAALISRLINGSLITLGEHPMLIRRSIGIADDSSIPDSTTEQIRRFVLSGIESYTP